MQIRVKVFMSSTKLTFIFGSLPVTQSSHGLHTTYDYSVKISHPNKRDAKGVFQTLLPPELTREKNWQKTEVPNSANYTRITTEATQTYMTSIL